MIGVGSSRSAWSVLSWRSLGSVLSAASVGSALSCGSALSVGSLASVGSAGSILSIGSSGSILSIGTAGRGASRRAGGSMPAPCAINALLAAAGLPRLTVGLRKELGTWVVAHEHHSVIDMS
jgi:hypothetical protein